ncbi:hypothetical protein RDWZM_001419 [Blomia tropicalis]|uniref:Serine/threonine-protein phosphatase 2A 55 kDa regulatory subunit B n=1 Tax=Blomia tropicalis TaxID=40697 RepID=A0A9Q0MCE1_BLOTA|nr:hypothetical protein RDWZM_001419 [Blomia tropicalis]
MTMTMDENDNSSPANGQIQPPQSMMVCSSTLEYNSVSSSTTNMTTSNVLQSNSTGDIRLAFSQVKGTLDDDVSDADIISCVEFSPDGDLLATGDKGGRIVIFQRDQSIDNNKQQSVDYNFYNTFQSHEAEFDYLKSLEIEEKINKIRWLKKKNSSNFLLSTNDKTVKLWKISERNKRFDGFNLKESETGQMRLIDPNSLTSLRVPVVVPSKMAVQSSARRIFANAHTYLINSISVNSDQETYLSADDLRINLWNIEINDESFNIVDIKPANMEELTEVITAAEFHPHHCNHFVYSSSKGILRLCDMRAAALCDRHSKIFEEPEDNSFFSEIISSISGIKFSNNGRYLISRDYMSIKVWDINMESKPVETYKVHEYLRSKLCSLFESDYIFDKFECSINGSDTHLMTGSYNNFFKIFDRRTKRDVMYEANKEIAVNSTSKSLNPRKVCVISNMAAGKKKKDEIHVDSLDFTSKILHTAWHPKDNVIAVAATNNLFLFKESMDDYSD